MAETVYLLCAAASVLCALLLWRGYRGNRTPLLFWSSLCFAGFALNNVLLFVDLVVLPEYGLMPVRNVIAVASIAILLHGLIRETR